MSQFAIYFERDGYAMDGRTLMGRQSAGHGFLRAAALAHADQALFACVNSAAAAQEFTQLVHSFATRAKPQAIFSDHFDALRRVGCLYLPGPGLADGASLRLRAGADAYSLMGVTHTTATHAVMDALADLMTGALMPWDALVCTSDAVLSTVNAVWDAQVDYLKWRFGRLTLPPTPQLPVIPLGVACEQFAFSAAQKAQARLSLNMAEDEVVMLYVGRLSFHAKAHPFPMYAGLQAVAQKTQKKVTLLQCGWFANEAIERAFLEGAKTYCPDCRLILLDGRKPEQRDLAWAAADVFVSLSDNVQETFGLTPVEAMAAGLPAIVSDWNGYKETVIDGENGFRIPTHSAQKSWGDRLAARYEAKTLNYDNYCGLSCMLTSVSVKAFAEKLELLVCDADLRRKMGESARARALQVFDWQVIFRRYAVLAAELAHERLAARKSPRLKRLLAHAPQVAPARLDLASLFSHYPTTHPDGETRFEVLAEESTLAGGSYAARVKHPLFSFAKGILPSGDLVTYVLSHEGQTLAALAEGFGTSLDQVTAACVMLEKMGLLSLYRH